MDPATISAGASVLSTYLRTYEFINEGSEEEKVAQSVNDAVKKFVFFYEDSHWDDLHGKKVRRSYQKHINKEANGFREIAVKADGVLDDETVKKLREISADLENIAMDNLKVKGAGQIGGKKVGLILEEELEDSYELSKEVVESLE
ncbi:hypothetical protein [Candidatus Nanohalococcus occultus]|uniref:Uncharacterized protein n=1 Tax=Candidatus Nanohalococcus occultus TaxID=2978047 RepID=A0ABY8CIT7_9ARCH|nr:hypothetical protein SVXNc_0917 [Candidatus Nanohaloarchaeota archaeon SVXNc]